MMHNTNESQKKAKTAVRKAIEAYSALQSCTDYGLNIILALSEHYTIEKAINM